MAKAAHLVEKDSLGVEIGPKSNTHILVSYPAPHKDHHLANKAYVDAQIGANDTLQEITDNGATTTTEVLLNGGVEIGTDGTLAEPAIKIGTTEDGFYELSSGQLGISMGNTLVGYFHADGLYIDELKPRVPLGTANTGVTASHTGDGKHFITTLTVSQTDAITVADNAALGDGYLLFTLPDGVISLEVAHMSMALSLASAEAQADTPDVGLGTTEASGAVAVLGGTAAFENIITGQTAADANGTATVKATIPTAGVPLIIEAGDDRTVYFNVAATWADDTGGDLTGDISGTVVLKWSLLA